MTLTPDLVVTGGRVLRPGASSSVRAAVVVTGDRIAAVVDEAEVPGLVGRRTEQLDAAGGLVLPGFQDAHVHPPTAGRNRLRLDLSDVAGRHAYVEAVGRYASEHPDEPWVIGGGWSMEHFPGGTPRREDLDAVVPDRPVFLYNRDVHGAWVNSRALELGGIGAATPDPADGRIERDDDATPTGTLHEGAAYSFHDHVVPATTAAEWTAAIEEAQRHLHGLGITGWQDAWVTAPTLAAYRGLATSGGLTARVVGALWWDRHRGMEQVAELVEARSSGAAPRFLPTSVKIMVDGVLENRTGALLEPYGDGRGGSTGESGLLYVEREALAEAVTELDRLGFQVHLHTIGDRAVRDALDAVAAARAANGPADRRHHLAHVQVVHPDDVCRFARLGVVATIQAFWAQHEPQMEELTLPFLGPTRGGWQYPFASLLRAGARLAMGSDWPVTTPDPLLQLEVATTRVDPERRDGPSFLPEERLTLPEALDAFTRGSAYVNGDDEAGRISPGCRADVAVLDRDVLAPDAGPVGEARVRFTVASGRVVHQSINASYALRADAQR